MKTIYKNSLSLPDELAIEEDTHLIFFYTGDSQDKKDTIHILVKPSISLEVTYIDFSLGDSDIHFQVDLLQDSKAELYFASLNHKTKKIYQVDVNHLEGRTYSRTKMGGINDQGGTLKFLGSSFIKNGAHKSDTRQEGKITNLSSDCKSEVSPSLLIKDNDVKASHGAALGAYNPEHLFYLMSRGLTLDESKKLITYGTLLPLIESAEDEKLVEEAKTSLGELSL